MSDKMTLTKMFCNYIRLEVMSIFFLFVYSLIIFVLCNQLLLLPPVMVIYSIILSTMIATVIFAYVVPGYLNTDSYTINWQDVKHYNSNPKSKLQSLSYHMHNAFNGQHAHAIYTIGTILVINVIFEYIVYV